MTTEHNVIYDWLYPLICNYRGVDAALIGDAGHKERMLADLKTADPFTKIDTRMKLGRWCSYHDKHGTYIPHRCVVLMVLTAHGINKKWWKSFEESPLCRSICDLLDVTLLEDDDADAPEVDALEPEDEAPPVAEVARGSKDPAPPPRRQEAGGRKSF